MEPKLDDYLLMVGGGNVDGYIDIHLATKIVAKLHNDWLKKHVDTLTGLIEAKQKLINVIKSVQE